MMRLLGRLAAGIVLLLLLSAGAARGADPMMPERTREAEAFVDQLSRGEFAAARARFDSTLAASLSEERLLETWNRVLAGAGAWERRTGIKTERSGIYDVVHVLCAFSQMPIDVKVVFNPEGRISGLLFSPAQATLDDWTIPDYADTSAFREEELTVGVGTWALPATLARPAGEGPFPALVLVHGSGPHDRDESIGPNRPFRDLAFGLASHGVAVLRYEKRTKVHGQRMAASPTLTVQAETIDDALAAVALLRTTPGIDPARIFVLGHSLGGMLLPRIAAADPAIAGLVFLAASARPMEESVIEQVAYITSLPTTSASAVEQLEALRLEALKAQALDPATADSSEIIMGVPAVYWLDLRAYRPAETAAALPQRMLVLHGERDYQVTSSDLDRWKAALGGRADVEFHSYPDLNHLFMTGTGRAVPAEYSVAGHVARVVISDVADWIRKPPAGGK